MSPDDSISAVLSESLGRRFTEAACGFYRLDKLFPNQGGVPTPPQRVFDSHIRSEMTAQSPRPVILNKNLEDLEWESEAGLVFDLASLTKALFTAPKIFQIACEKGLSFYQPLETFLASDLKSLLNPELRRLTLASLLSHSSGLPGWANLWVDCESQRFLSQKEKLLFHLNRLGENINPAQGMVYSDLGFLLLGLIIESESRKSLRECLADWNLLSGASLSFSPTTKACASAGFCAWRQKELFGEVHDENCSSLGGACGHAGLFGNLKDVSTHLKWLFTTGFGQAFLHHNALLRKTGDFQGDGLLGLRQGLAAHAKPFSNGRAMGHLGFTGTSFWIDPESLSFYVFLTNRVALGRLSKGIMDVRTEVSKLAQSYFFR